jgi:peptide subunit release factor 1 (eRF1)
MLAEATSRIGALAIDGAWIVIGGIPVVATTAVGLLAPDLAARATRAEHLDVHATDAQVAECARESASMLRDAEDLRRIEEAVSLASSGGAGAIGIVDTQRALELAQVRELFITQKFLENQAADADAAVRRAMDEGATVEHVSGEAAARVDALGGMAARLRYAPPREAALQTALEPEDIPA